MSRFFDEIIRDERKGFRVGLLKILLWIGSWIYWGAVRIRNAGYEIEVLPEKKLPKPVISVGNMTVGGSGKTPLVIWLVRRLIAEGYRPAILSRGYQSSSDENGNDEVQMMRQMCPDVPVLVGQDRYETAMWFLSGHDVDVFVMDDGFQHRMLARDFDLVAVESLRGFGNGHLLPRGILREPLSELKRADVIALTKMDVNPDGEKVIKKALNRKKIVKPMIYVRQRVTGLTHLSDSATQDKVWLNGRDVVAVSSIADPQSFEKTLKQQGARIAEKLFYPDHYHYQAEDFNRFSDVCRARAVNTIVTTSKDAVKLNQFLSVIPEGINIWVLNIELELRDDENILGQRIHHLLRT